MDINMSKEDFVKLLKDDNYCNVEFVTENGITICSFLYNLVLDTETNLILLYSSEKMKGDHRITINFNAIKKIRTWSKESIIELTI